MSNKELLRRSARFITMALAEVKNLRYGTPDLEETLNRLEECLIRIEALNEDMKEVK